MGEDARLLLPGVEDVDADDLLRFHVQRGQTASFCEGEGAPGIERHDNDGRVVEHLAQARLGVAQRLGGAARVGGVDHEADQLALGHGVCLGAEPALLAIGGDHAVLDLPLLAVGGDGAQQREHCLTIVGVQPLDQELRVAGELVGGEAEAGERSAGSEGHLEGVGVSFEDDRVEAAEEVDRRRLLHGSAGAACLAGQ